MSTLVIFLSNLAGYLPYGLEVKVSNRIVRITGIDFNDALKTIVNG